MWTAAQNDVIVGRHGTGKSFSLWNMSADVNNLKTSIVQSMQQLRRDLDNNTENINSDLDQLKEDTDTKLDELSKNVISNLQVQSDATRDAVDAVAKDLFSAKATLTGATGENSKSINSLTSQLKSTQDALTASSTTLEKVTECSKKYEFLQADGKCGPRPVSTDLNMKTCNKDLIGGIRFHTNTSALEICLVKGKKFAWQEVVQTQVGTELSPAKGGQDLLDAGITESGLYWIKPTGDSKAAETYCDMKSYGGGYCLANVGFVGATDHHSSNRNLINMNRPNGYKWKPNARQNTHMLIDLPSGAVNMAQGSPSMIMAAGGNPNSGGLGEYPYVYEINLREHAKDLSFVNGNRYHGGCGQSGFQRQPLVNFKVTGKKGDIGSWNKRATKQSMMLSWSDSYPAGYGFSSTRSSCTSSWNDGPFFPSVHCGDGRGGYGQWERMSSPPDVQEGRFMYTYRGWYRVGNGKVNNKGQTSIWFK